MSDQLTILRPSDDDDHDHDEQSMLEELAGRIDAAHERTLRSAKEMFNAAEVTLWNAARCGRYLIEAKSRLNHGEFIPFVDKHCHFGKRTAQEYMRIARDSGAIQERSAAAHLDQPISIRRALSLLKERNRCERKIADRLGISEPPVADAPDPPIINGDEIVGDAEVDDSPEAPSEIIEERSATWCAWEQCKVYLSHVLQQMPNEEREEAFAELASLIAGMTNSRAAS